MKKKKSIRTMIVAIVLGVLIPVNVLTAMIYSALYGHIRSMVMEVQKDTVQRYASQWEHQLENIERYTLEIVNDPKWLVLQGEVGSHVYELNKVALQKEIQNRTSDGMWNQADSICIEIDHSREMLEAHSGKNLTYEASMGLRKWMIQQPLQSWNIQYCEERPYLFLHYGGNIFHMAVGIQTDTIAENWVKDSGFPMEIRSDGNFAKRAGSAIVKVPFLKKGMEMAVYLPDSYINQAMPIQYFLMFVSLAAGIVLILFLYVLLRKYLIIPLGNMQATLEKIRNGEREHRMQNCASTVEMEAIESSFNRLMDQIYLLEIKNYEAEIENQKAQLMNLQLQINPHLLLNTLNTIYGLSEIEDYKNIQDFTLNLVKYFRYSLKHIDELVTLSQELDFVKSYAAVQLIRYPESFYIIYDVEDELLMEQIPPLLIENFVENSAKSDPGHKMTEILVIVKKKEDRLTISICDNGEGIEESVLELLKSGHPYQQDGVTHVGIYNCVRRLRLFYGEDMQFTITSQQGEGTQVWMEIPCKKEDAE